ncbi:MAG: alpha/beta hydrolase family protein [Marmoricola sp.]
MAVIRCDFFSDVLELGTSMSVILPERAESQIGTETTARTRPPPVLYLLHGLSDDDTMWLRATSIDRYASALGMAVIMPQVHRSFYTDLPHGGGRYWTFLSEELPGIVGDFFNVSQRREDTFVAGLSMGGFGALKWAFAEPERFSAAASLSGAVDVPGLVASGERDELFTAVLGGRSVSDAGGDLFSAASALSSEAAPRIYLCCGTEDDQLISGNRKLAGHLAEHRLDVTADFGPGEHEWGYWDAKIRDVLAWFDL